MKADLHIHSSYSVDGRDDPILILKHARKIGLDAVAITDHNSIDGYKKVKNEAVGIILVPGIEVSTSDGHVIGLWIKDHVPSALSIAETVEKIHDFGGIAVAAHPYRVGTGIGENNIRMNSFDVIEAMNGRCVLKNNKKSTELAKELKKPISAGSDAHEVEHVGTVYLEYEGNIQDAIMNGNGTAKGASRDIKDSVKYAKKVVEDWIKRGFKNI